MCGIAGYVGPREIPVEDIDRCLASMRRRGPDAAKVRTWTTDANRRVYLLNSRLSIIDLDARSNQPLSRGPLTVTYNGEIYNYVELREELSAKGVGVWCTRSDTEVLLASLESWGDEAWSRLDGMWAAAIFDERDGSLTLSRDVFGEKPLYILSHASGLYFGSEPKFIVALLGQRLKPNIRQLHRFLVNGYRSLYKTRETFFEDLEELPAASVMSISADGTRAVRRFWRPTMAPDEGVSYEEAVAGVRERLVGAVARRLRADVPLAFCLSGGIDSNALVSIASRLCGYAVQGYTIFEDDPRYDERALVLQSVEELGVAHTAVDTTSDGFVERMRLLVGCRDAPVYTISYYAHALLMNRIASDGFRVAVSGTGADEIFSGYYDHHLAYLAHVSQGASAAGEARTAWERNVRPFVRNPYLSDPDLFVNRPEFRDHLYLGADRYAALLTHPWREPFTEEVYSSDLLRNRMLNELLHETVPVILHEDDSNAMCWSVENRSPFLDRSLVEFCGRVPTRHLVRNGLAKALLRDAVRGIAPDVVLDNPRKAGFNAPITSFLDCSDPAVRAWLLRDSPIYDHVEREAIEALLNRATLPNSDSKFLFSFVSSKLFLDEFAL